MQHHKSLYFLIFLILFTAGAKSQSNDKPRLVVGIVVDQMRFEYLYRFKNCYSEDGFKRLMRDGTNFTFAHLNYIPTSTGPGHATIYTGTTPFYHGIIGNNFYDRSQGKSVYCVGDENYHSVGSDDAAGQKSPKRLLTTTITDELKISTNGRSKIIAVSLKDRGAVLPGGHNPDGAYWYNDKTGNFVTSSYYTNSLPGWVIEFNNRKLPDVYLAEGWKLSLEEEKYEISSPDESNYEKDRFKEGKTSFPHYFNNLSENEKYGEFENTPFANQIVVEFAKAALYNENLGRGNETDFLAISFSATDHMGHEYGTLSYELQDTYLKLDEQLAGIFKALDDQVGQGNYLLFITADHAAIPTPGYLKDNGMPTGELNQKKTFELIKNFAQTTYADEKIIADVSNKQIFLDWELLKKKNLDRHKVQKEIADFLRENNPAITSIFTRDFLETQISFRDQKNALINGFNPSLSGDVVFEIRPGYQVNFLEKGTTHGSSYNYDTHVPLIFYGWNVPAQTVNTPVYSIDIAPTIADLLKITEPSAAIGIPLIR